ncbi:Phosphonoacetaldehyde hydrolase [Candidatus Sulfopaludibacter sp. SbA4]|nr:Phosphonoacetaldehyde hydrolase [Candidatus Sulfopaludibacter sp. SbA4]
MKLTRRQSLATLAAAAALPARASRLTAAPAIRLVVLDVGGTIIEDRGDVPALLRSALAHHGIEVTPAAIGQWRGASKREVVRRFVEQKAPPDADRDQLTAAIYREFSSQLNEVYRTVPPIAGAEDAFRKLAQSGYLLATTTGFDRDITTRIFRRLGWEHYFVASITSDDVVLGRPSPFMLFHAMEFARVNSVAEVVAVGDTPLDLRAGSNAAMRGVVGVLSGVGTAEQLRREPHTHILPSVAALPALLGQRRPLSAP